MADNVKVLRRRLRSIRNTRQITRAMEMVSAAKLRRAQDVLMAGRPYAAKLHELLSRLAPGVDAGAHPLFQARPVHRRVLVPITADRGLAGAFNAQIVKRTESMLRETPESASLVCAGRKGYDYFRTKRWPILSSVTDFGGKLSVPRSRGLADRLIELFVSGQADEVVLIYNAFVSTVAYHLTVEKLLPLDPGEILAASGQEHARRGTEYILEPSAKRVFSELPPRYVQGRMYIVLAETFAAEHSARMVAMSGATKNCDDLISSVGMRMNKARQAAITKEILEIVAGAEALRG